jgi:hypothetical protein
LSKKDELKKVNIKEESKFCPFGSARMPSKAISLLCGKIQYKVKTVLDELEQKLCKS